MHSFTIILILIIAIEHIGIMGLELLGSESLLAKSFNLPIEEVKRPHLRSALANQGLYNGFVALALILTIFVPSGRVLFIMTIGFLACIFVIAAYGSLTVSKKIILIQGLPALIALFFSFFFL